MTKAKDIQIQFVPIELCEFNEGQIPGVPENPRTREDSRQKSLEKSIEELPEMTVARAALCYKYNGKYVVIGGNRRLEAQIALKRKSIPVIALPEDIPMAKLRRIALLDNESTGQTDWNKLAKDWDIAEIESWNIATPKGWEKLTSPEAKDDNYTPPSDVEPKVKAGEIWQLGKHRLMCGDSTILSNVRKLTSGNIVDLLVIDPPYNVDYSSKNEMLNLIDKGNRIQTDIENDRMRDAEFLKFMTKALQAVDDVLKKGGVYYIWHAGTEGYNFCSAIRNVGWPLKQCLIWVKNTIVIGRQDYQWRHEPCLYGWKEGAAHYFMDDRSQSTIFEDEAPDYRKMKKSELIDLLTQISQPKLETTVIRENKPLRSENHPTMKPVRLIGRCVRNSSRAGEIVLDTFGGSGTTMIACEQLGRKCYMMEIDPKYCDVIINRWETLTGQKAHKIE